MHYKTNRLNHDFQIVYFLVGACHTADAAYALLCDLEEDREVALDAARAASLRHQAAVLKANRLKVADEAETRLEGAAQLMELDSEARLTTKNVLAAEMELATIRKCKAALEPHRKFAHLTLPEAHEAAQAEEWKLEFMFRATNCLLAGTNVPADQIAAMRKHPAFNTEIWPHICNTRKSLMETGSFVLPPNDISEVLKLALEAPQD